ncbi:MAG: Fic family protein, partial [Gemmatimonadales bacterium]
NYWRLVRIALNEYAPAEIFRISAVRLLVGEFTIPETLLVRHSASKSEHQLQVTEGLEIALVPDELVAAGSSANVVVPPDGPELPVSSPAATLVSLTAGDVRRHRDLVLSWLRSLVIAEPALEAAYAATPRHVLLTRMGHLAQDLGNTRLHDQIQRVLALHHRRPRSRTDTGVGRDIVVPAYLASRPSSRDPGLDRLQARFERGAADVSEVVHEVERKVVPRAASQILEAARSAKLEDTYHSTTIEGYEISRDEVRSVLEGVAYEGRSRAETERLMALKGYSRAFDRILELIPGALADGGTRLTESLIFDLHLELWGPSIDAGVVSAEDMRGWRSSNVFIRHSRHVPPGPEKVGRHMPQLLEQVNDPTRGPITRAILAHWGFVHIHPFMDGNGRLARLLMNFMLAGSGIPWATVRAEGRPAYFAALEQAHVNDDLRPLAEFLLRTIGPPTTPAPG